ncbi:11513_t:CDS:2, partial [Ambispora gerdemannii]
VIGEDSQRESFSESTDLADFIANDLFIDSFDFEKVFDKYVHVVAVGWNVATVGGGRVVNVGMQRRRWMVKNVQILRTESKYGSVIHERYPEILCALVVTFGLRGAGSSQSAENDRESRLAVKKITHSCLIWTPSLPAAGFPIASFVR